MQRAHAGPGKGSCGDGEAKAGETAAAWVWIPGLLCVPGVPEGSSLLTAHRRLLTAWHPRRGQTLKMHPSVFPRRHLVKPVTLGPPSSGWAQHLTTTSGDPSWDPGPESTQPGAEGPQIQGHLGLLIQDPVSKTPNRATTKAFRCHRTRERESGARERSQEASHLGSPAQPRTPDSPRLIL